MIDKQIVTYLIEFIINDSHANNYVHYGNPGDSDKPVVIVPSCFFEDSFYGSRDSAPSLPLKELKNEILFLYGDSRIERNEKQTVIYADLIASAYFLVTRYDEAFFETERDAHKRPIGKRSFKEKAGILNRPLVDEYGEFLREELRRHGIELSEKRGLNHVYLTHDVDHPWMDYSLADGIKQSAKNVLIYRMLDVSPFFNSLGLFKWNSCDTFDWMLQQDDRVKKAFSGRADDVYFIIGACEKTALTYKYWDDKKAIRLIRKLQEKASILGIHASYESSADPTLFVEEQDNLQKRFSLRISANRNHYLMSNDVEWLRVLEENGVTDDFTMGYADTTGFRLSTTRPVRWINPRKKKLFHLVLHPLSVMDGTLYSSQYMGLEKDGVKKEIIRMIECCRRYHGDFVMLLHNDVINDGRYRWFREVYQETMEYLCAHID